MGRVISDSCKFSYTLETIERLSTRYLSGYRVFLGKVCIGHVYLAAGVDIGDAEWEVTDPEGKKVEGTGHMQPCGSTKTQRAAVALLVEEAAKGFPCFSKSSPTL